MPAPVPKSPRFDIGAVSRFQSRDGSLAKGGQVRNGFVEPGPTGILSWQRPALVTRTASPVVGEGLGLLVYNSTLFGVYRASAGTATTAAT